MVLPQLFFLGNRHFLYWKSSTCSATDGRLPPPTNSQCTSSLTEVGFGSTPPTLEFNERSHQIQIHRSSRQKADRSFRLTNRGWLVPRPPGRQTPRSTTPCLDITGHIHFFMRNITGWITMSIEKITGRRFFSIERITGNFGSSLMNCSRQPVRYAVRKTKIAVLRFLFYSLHVSSLV